MQDVSSMQAEIPLAVFTLHHRYLEWCCHNKCLVKGKMSVHFHQPVL